MEYLEECYKNRYSLDLYDFTKTALEGEFGKIRVNKKSITMEEEFVITSIQRLRYNIILKYNTLNSAMYFYVEELKREYNREKRDFDEQKKHMLYKKIKLDKNIKKALDEVLNDLKQLI